MIISKSGTWQMVLSVYLDLFEAKWEYRMCFFEALNIFIRNSGFADVMLSIIALLAWCTLLRYKLNPQICELFD